MTRLISKIFLACFSAAALLACQEHYSFNAGFSVPDTLSSPESIVLDVTSSEPVIFSWSGGGADDGGIVLYNVLFDKEGGDFSSPLATFKSDLGAEPQLSLAQSSLNTIARNAGIHPEETGKIIWTVTASKGGVVQQSETTATITVTRGEGIDNIPSELYLFGTATENSGSEGIPFRCVEDGIFQIYTTISSGNLYFSSSQDYDAFTYYADSDNKLKEGDGVINVESSDNVIRLTVNYNTLAVSMEQVDKSVRCIWGATFDNIAVLDYAGNGKFVGEGDIIFIQQDRPETNPPSWLSWTEERYYFIATVDGEERCWGRGEDVSAERPTGSESPSFYAIYEYTWSQWEHLWKMSGSLDMTHATITIDTNADNLMIHSFSNVTSL